MKKMLIATAAAAAVALTAGAASAQVSVQLNGNVQAACNLPVLNETRTVDLSIDSNGYLAVGNDGGMTKIFDLGDETGNAELWCNTSSDVTIQGSRLVHISKPITHGTFGIAGNPTFTDTLPMIVDSLTVGGANGVAFPVLSTGGNLDVSGGQLGKMTLTSAGAFAGPIDGNVNLWHSTKRPIAGDYRAQWTLTITPN